MEDIIDIIVTETTNLIEITSQPTDEIIDVNIIDNREDITLNVTPSVVEININSLTGNFGVNWGDIEGTLADQTDLQNVLNAKADLVDGKVPSSQLPSYVDDVIEVANYAALPVTGEVGKIYITLDTNFIYRWSGSTYIEIKDSSAVWGAITGTLSSQTDLQSALDAKVPYTGATGNVNLGEYGATVGYLGFDTTPTSTPTGIGTTYWDSFYRTLSLIDGDGDTTLQIGQEQRVLVHNNTGSTLTDGQVVYVIGSTGELPSVALASNTSETTSSVTFGIVTESIAHGANGFITTSGIIHGLNTNAYDEGAAIYLGSTAGTFTQTKPVAPANSVLVGYIIKKSGGNGSIFVKIQNGYELEELHDVLITSKANNDGLFYESSTSLWKNKSIATVLGGTPITGSGATGYYARFTSSNVISDGFIQTTSNITYVEGMGLSTGSGLDIEGSFGGGSDGLKLRSYDETTGKAYIEFFNTSGNFRLGLEGSTGGGILPGSTAYATVLTSGLTAKNLEFGTNNTKRLTLDGTTGAATFTSSVTTSALYVTGMTAGSGAIYHTGSRLTFANYNTSGTLHFEVNGGVGALTLNADKSATFESTLSATGATLTGALSGTSATFTGTSASSVLTLANSSGGTKADFTITENTGLIINSYEGASARSINLQVGGASALSIATSGAATFSSSVTASGGVNAGDSKFFNSVQLTDSLGGTCQGFLWTDAANTLKIGTGTVAGGNVKMTITSAGNVGIGTTSPSELLHLSKATYPFIKLTETTSNTSGQFGYDTPTAEWRMRTLTSTPLTFGTNDTERMRIASGGNVLINKTTARGNEYLGIESGGNEFCNFQSTGGVRAFRVNNVDVEGFNTTGTTIFVGKLNSSGRSINAGGTINAMGLDYAEYMTKSTSENINKGDIVGIDSNGLLTDLFELSISFGIKSTNPSFVGGDEWGANKDDTNLLEQERQKVDRIAFSGQVPCNVLGANVGDYIIPVNDNGKIKGIAVSNPTFEQYQISVGKVWKIMEDGRAWVAVKIG